MEQRPGDPYLGQMIRGYRLEKQLGQGQITSLYRAHTRELWQNPTLTVVLLHSPRNLTTQARERFLARFEQQAREVAKLRHPSLFPLFGYGTQEDYAYLMLPDASGVTLAEYRRQRQNWALADIFSALAPIAEALDYIHGQGLVYQYLNPGNIIFPDGEPPRITGLYLGQMLSLAGLSEDRDHEPDHAHLLNIAGMPIGQAEYLAPEVIKGENVDGRADVYSLGCMLFELLSGHPLYYGHDYMEIARKHVRGTQPSLQTETLALPLALEIVINRALQHNPHRRFATPGEMLTACFRALGRQQLLAQTLRQRFPLRQTQPLDPEQTSSRSTTILLPRPSLWRESTQELAPRRSIEAMVQEIQQKREKYQIYREKEEAE